MPKLPECDCCLFCAHDYHIVCTLHPAGVEEDSCMDFRPKPKLEGKHFKDFLGVRSRQRDDEPYSNPYDLEPDEELWEPEGARFVNWELVIERDNDSSTSPEEHRSFYNGEEIIQPRQRWTPLEQLELLNTHPIFTGRCPACNQQFLQGERPPVHWDCGCGWIDDSV